MVERLPLYVCNNFKVKKKKEILQLINMYRNAAKAERQRFHVPLISYTFISVQKKEVLTNNVLGRKKG